MSDVDVENALNYWGAEAEAAFEVAIERFTGGANVDTDDVTVDAAQDFTNALTMINALDHNIALKALKLTEQRAEKIGLKKGVFVTTLADLLITIDNGKGPATDCIRRAALGGINTAAPVPTLA